VSAVSAAGVILAAGESRRMGSPKALLRYRGQTFLDTLISLFAPHCSPVIVVLGADADEIRRGLSCDKSCNTSPDAASHVTFVINPDYRTGQTSSMQCGLRAVPAGAEGVLFTLADHPAVAASTIDALAAHGAARDVVYRHVDETEYLDVNDPGIVADIDDPAAYRELIGAEA
jgi:molybdenum cofactor cytidylyltransferase